jgi:Tol biopolymer transport system component
MVRKPASLAIALLIACAAKPPAQPAAAAGVAGNPPAAPPTQLTEEQKARGNARAPLATALIDAFVNGQPDFSPDGTKVLFQSNREGSPQLYLADATNPASPPLAISHGPERTDFAAFTRDGRSILFLRDQGADENFRIYRVGLDGKRETNLTPGPVLHRDPFVEPKGKPGTIAYTQHDPKSPASELVVQPLDGAPRVVYTDPAPAFLTETTPDGSRALLVRSSRRATSCSSRSTSAQGRREVSSPAKARRWPSTTRATPRMESALW